jgi:hypothetical protein
VRANGAIGGVKPGVETGECGPCASRRAVDTDGLSDPVLPTEARRGSAIVMGGGGEGGGEGGRGAEVDGEGSGKRMKQQP